MPIEAPLVDRDPYAVLAREHRLIERALDVLSRLCDEARRSKRLDASDATEIIRFLRAFADGTHHLKEEKILFPAIEARTFFPGCGLVSEHELGRERVARMASVLEGAAAGDAGSLQVFVRQARSLIGLLRDHIAKEDDCLANVVHRAFSGGDLMRLTEEFEESERREMGEGTFERFAAIVDTLEAKRDSGNPESGTR